MNRMKAKDVMSQPVVTLRSRDAISDAAKLLSERRISGAPVVDEHDNLTGIVTEGDILMKQAGGTGRTLLSYLVPAKGREAEEEIRRVAGKTVEDIMTREVVKAHEETPLRELAATMARNAINRIPIVRNGQVVGIVTRNDILKAYSRPDQVLEAEVRGTILHDLWIDPAPLEIEVHNGLVVLRGQLDRRTDVRLVETFVREVDGVVAVDTSGLSYRFED